MLSIRQHVLAFGAKGKLEMPSKSNKRLINVGAEIEQRLLQSTVRNHPISAETASVAPNAFLLPPVIACGKVVISTKPTAPSYTFGHRTKAIESKAIGPGPGEYNPAGRISAPRSPRTSYLRIPLRKKGVENESAGLPGPADYVIKEQRVAEKNFKQPKKVGGQNRFDSLVTMPAPNAYRLPPVVGTVDGCYLKAAPSYTIGGRIGKPHKSSGDIPGPGTYCSRYNLVTKRDPHFTMGFRRTVEDKIGTIPGPSDYAPEQCVFKGKSVPAPSIGIRHSEYLGKMEFAPFKCDEDYGLELK